MQRLMCWLGFHIEIYDAEGLLHKGKNKYVCIECGKSGKNRVKKRKTYQEYKNDYITTNTNIPCKKERQ